MLIFVLFYFVVVFTTFALDDQKIARLICGDWITKSCKEDTLNVLDAAFYVIDVVFLTLFLLEISVKLLALGCTYLRDWINLADFAIIVVSMLMTILVLTTNILEAGGSAVALLPLFKVIRLLRVVLVMTRLQRTHDRMRRMRMVGLAAPVEKVFEIITELRQKIIHTEDDKALAWTMDLIAKEELYKVSFTDSKSSSGMHLTAEMTDWLRSNLQASLPGGLLKAQGSLDSSQSGKRQGSISGPGPTNGRRSSHQSKMAVIPSWISKSLESNEVGKILETIDNWDFDVFALHDATNGNPLTVGGMYLMQRMGITDKIPIPKDKLANLLHEIERGYVANNPFHNALHATDVMFTTNFFLQAPLLRDMTGSLDKFAAVLAGAAHDYAHPGLSNPFLISTREDKAVLYNDQSVLEMFHIAGSFRIMLTNPNCDVSEYMSREQFRQFRETMVSMVLATDLKTHFEHLGRLKTRVATDMYASVERKDVLLLLGQALHAADISNPCKTRPLMLRWTERVMKEFWGQGAKEKELGLPVSAFMDRTQPQVPQCQLGFINVLVKPLFIEWQKLLGDIASPAIQELETSLKIWELEGAGPSNGWEKEDFVR